MGYKNPTLGVMLAVVGCCCSATGYTLQKLAHRRAAAAKLQSTNHHRSTTTNTTNNLNNDDGTTTDSTLSNNNDTDHSSSSSSFASSSSSSSPPLPYYRYWQFIAGVLFLVIGALFSIVVFSLAGQSELAPMGAVTMIANQVYAKFVLKETFTRIDVISTALMALGTTIAIIFSEKTNREYNLEELFTLLNRTEAVIGTIIMVSCLILGALFVRFLDWHLKRKEKQLHNLRQELPHLDPNVPDILNTTPSSSHTTTVTNGSNHHSSASLSSVPSLTIRNPSPMVSSSTVSRTFPVIPLLDLTNMEKSLDCIGRAMIGGFVGGYTGLTTKSFVELVANAFVNGHWENLTTVKPYGFLLALICCLYFQLNYLNSGLARHDSARVIPLYQSSLIFASVFSGWLYFDEIAVQTTTSLTLFGIGVLITTSGMLLLIRKSTMQNNHDNNNMINGWVPGHSNATTNTNGSDTTSNHLRIATPAAIEMTTPSKYDKHHHHHQNGSNGIQVVMHPSSSLDQRDDDDDHIQHQETRTLLGTNSSNVSGTSSGSNNTYSVTPLVFRAASFSYRQQTNNYPSTDDTNSSNSTNNLKTEDQDTEDNKYHVSNSSLTSSLSNGTMDQSLIRLGKQFLSGISPLPGLSTPARSTNNSGTNSYVSTPVPSKVSSTILTNTGAPSSAGITNTTNVPPDFLLPYSSIASSNSTSNTVSPVHLAATTNRSLNGTGGPSYVSFHSVFSDQENSSSSSSSSNSSRTENDPTPRERIAVMNSKDNLEYSNTMEVTGVNISSPQPRLRKIGE